MYLSHILALNKMTLVHSGAEEMTTAFVVAEVRKDKNICQKDEHNQLTLI